MGAIKRIQETGTRHFLDRSQVAEMLGLSVKTLDRWALLGIGPRFRRLGRAVRYDLADVEAFIQKSPIGGGPTAA
jgi:predicted DNA-binding transcriptional regulator AlpA